MLFKRYRDWSIRSKIISIPLISLVLIIAGTELLIVPKISDWLMEQEMQKVRNVVEVAFQQFIEAEQSVSQGAINVEDAQRHVQSAVSRMRYSEKEYLWINDVGKPFPKMVMHPTIPTLNGVVLNDAKFNKATSMRDGLNGNIRELDSKNLFVSFNEVAERAGHGYVTYEWPKPVEGGGVTDELYTKLSYVKIYKPWGWVVGSGLYIDAFKLKVQKLHKVILGSTAVISCLLILLVWRIARGIKRSVDDDQNFAAAVASGDLTNVLTIVRHDELGELGTSLNSMVTELRTMIANITSNSVELSKATDGIGHASRTMVVSAELQQKDVQNIKDAADEISRLIENVNVGVSGLNSSVVESSSTILELSASIDEVARNMELLASSVDDIGSSISHLGGAICQIDSEVQALDSISAETASSVLELDSSIRNIQSYANESYIVSAQVISDAESGKSAVDATIVGIGQIKNSSRITAESVNALSQKAKSIGSIVTVIEEIAQQTNLLALNASIIAAQAGVHGLGFSVVAKEIKELAERTTCSTREIGEVISGVQAEITGAVISIGVASESIHNGESLSQQAGTVLEQIVSGVHHSSQQISEISRVTKEQANSSDNIRSALVQIASMSTSIAQNTDKQRKESELIQAEANKVRQFSTDVMQSMKEQANAGDLIGSLSLKVSDMSDKIQAACVEQSIGRQRIVESVERISRSSADVLHETRVVDSGVERLAMQKELLIKEISDFKV
jgi:methyl-accepting chemotaxis protein